MRLSRTCLCALLVCAGAASAQSATDAPADTTSAAPQPPAQVLSGSIPAVSASARASAAAAAGSVPAPPATRSPLPPRALPHAATSVPRAPHFKFKQSGLPRVNQRALTPANPTAPEPTGTPASNDCLANPDDCQ